MATFEELFPEYAGSPPAAPFEPIKTGRVMSGIDLAQDRADTALSGSPEADLDELMAGYKPASPQGETSWADVGKTIVSGLGGLGEAAAGAGEYATNYLAGDRASAPQQALGDLSASFGEGRRASGAFAQDWFKSMSPEAQNRAMREFTTLDPNKTIWQGGAGEFLSSVGLKMANAAPSTLVTLLPGGLMMRAGLGRGAISYLGASEGALSMGSIAANIADEIERAPEAELMQSQLYQQLRQEMDDQSARQVLIKEAQGQAPLIGGLLVGAISAVAGRYLEPVFSDAAGGMASRFGRGAVSEGLMQEGPQSAAEQIAQNIAAQTFDSSRGAMQGAGEAFAQGAAVGMPMGGTFGALAGGGQQQQALPLPSEEALPAAEAPAGPEAFDAVFQEQESPGGWRGSALPDLGPDGTRPDIDSSGQRLMDVGAVDPAVQAALNIRRDRKMDDLFSPPNPESPMQQVMQQAGQISQQGDMFPTPIAGPQRPEPMQRPLGVIDPERGTVIKPMTAQPLVEDMSAPPGFAGAPTEEGAPPTFRDARQQDMFGDPPLTPDQPSAEPLGDLNAQLADLADPDSPRLGVYLSSANMQQVGEVPSLGVPLANFDGKGGTLIAKNRQAAEQLLALRNEGGDMQQVLGLATGAGTGKPVGADIAVQQRDEAGNVVRESLVATPEEADALAMELDAPGREGVVLSAGMAIKRRAQRIAGEQAAAREGQTAKAARRTVEDMDSPALPQGAGDVAAQYQVLKTRLAAAEKAASDAPTRGERIKAGEDVKQLSAQMQALREDTERGVKSFAKDSQFPDTRKALEETTDEAIGQMPDEQVDELFGEAVGFVTGSKAKIGGIAGGKMFGGDTSLPRVLTKESRKRVPESAELKRYKELTDEVIPRLTASAKTSPWFKKRLALANDEAKALRSKLDSMKPPKEAPKMFPATPEQAEAETRDFMRRTQPDDVGTRETADIDATTRIDPSGRTVEEIVAAHPARSQKLKFISRAKRLMRMRAIGKNTKSRDITAKGGVREGVAKEDSTAVRKSELHPTKAFDLEPPREMSQADRAKHNARVRKAYSDLDKKMLKFSARLEQANAELAKKGDEREDGGNPPHMARTALYGRSYFNTLYRYGQMLNNLHPRSKAGLKEVERFNKLMDSLLDKKGDAFLNELSKAMQAESEEQARAAIKADPTTLKNMGSRRQRRMLTALDSKSRRTSIAWAKRLHDVWHKNSKYNEVVAPLIQKLVGYVTRDVTNFNAAERRGMGYVPTFNEMRNLRYALREFKQTNKEGLYDPLRDWFTDFGYKFDDSGDLVLARKPSQDGTDPRDKLSAESASQFEYTQPTKVMEQGRDAMQGAPKNYNQKVMSERRRQLNAAKDAEKARRAALTPAQQRREDITLANRIEKDRRSGMTYEQRRALESLDRQSPLYLVAEELSRDVPAMRSTAQIISDALEEGVPDLDGLMAKVAASLPAGPLRDIAQRLASVGMPDAAAAWDTSGNLPDNVMGEMDDSFTDHTGARRRILRINRSNLTAKREMGQDASWDLVHTFLHESLHAASMGALRNNSRLRVKMHALMMHARSTHTGSKPYGFTNVDEFVAEAFTNPAFQETLKGIESNDKSLWRRFVDAIKEFFGFSGESALDVIMAHSDQILTGEFRERTAGHEAAPQMLDGYSRSHVAAGIDRVLQSNRLTKRVRDMAVSTFQNNKEGGSSFLLSALSMEQMRDFYYKAFNSDTANPLADYMRAFFQRNADNSANMEHADALSRQWTKLTEQDEGENSVELSRVMAESTLYGIHPDESITSEGNKHVTSLEQRGRHTGLAKRFKALPEPFKKQYRELKAYYKETLQKEVNLVTLNSLRAMIDGPFDYTEADVERKKLNTEKGILAEFGDKISKEHRKLIARTASLPANHVGPYFPLMRFGTYVVSAEREKSRRTFATEAEAREYYKEQDESDPTLSVLRDGTTVIVKEKEVRMAETASEAEQHRKEMVETYGEDNVDREIRKKSDLYKRGASIGGGASLRSILGKLDGNPAAQAAVKDFYLRSLGESAFRKREIKRTNRRGVNYDLQHRTFASYAKSAAYYMSQLRYGSKLADALIAMDKFTNDVGKGDESSSLSAVRLHDVVHEINTRDKLTHDPIEVSKLVRHGTEISQFMMLTSPSYWLINATQPYMVTLPWLAARSSVGEATAALTSAQALIRSPILNQMGSSGGGLKALWSKTAAEDAFTVLEQVEDHISKRGGARASEYKQMLDKLKRDSIIDLSFVAELRDISEGINTSHWQKVLDASRIMSHLTEVNNRIMTAIAAYDLYRNKGSSVTEAQEFAKQAVSLTQFNYSAGNAPRLFQARGPLGQMGPLVFQFMKYPQHMYALMIDNFRRAVRMGTMDAKVARKTLLGLLGTHLMAGGVVGAMLQPVKWAIGLTMAAFGDDDEPYTFANAMSGETADRMIRESLAELLGNDLGEIAGAGLPRAAGVDLSARMSLGTLYMIDLNPKTSQTMGGSLLQTFGGPTYNLMAGAFDGVGKMGEGQTMKGLESFMPKGVKDVAKMIRYSSEGLTDASGKEIIGAKDMNPWDLFTQSVGFQPSNVAEKYAARTAINDQKQFSKDRHNSLLRRFQNAEYGDRADLLREVAEFNRGNPAERITRSALLKSKRAFQKRERLSRRYGTVLEGDDVMYADEADAYN